ncbi:putative capsid head morphogenesis protein [Carnobacterium phage cd3]|uniref:Capsid head morphogenesis protein n=1 Tax=Carnobacterium phage cd2 TaxID=2849244 RepID=A0AAE7SRD6_9CAUD|nr:head morphogenesis [Carnobacterium phage cd2]QXP45137.1 putative capsid head morphogenesis protein [Carnobacterium phage cd2]QXP45307.1 putative capsid head morphogenesis protein [Carnobacterium phage cd3]
METRKALEDKAVRLMLLNHAVEGASSSELEADVNLIVGQLLALLLKHQNSTTYFNTAVGSKELQTIYDRLYQLADEYAERVTDELIEAYIQASETFSTEDLGSEVYSLEEELNATRSDLLDEMGVEDLQASFEQIVREAIANIQTSIRYGVALGNFNTVVFEQINKSIKRLTFRFQLITRTLTSKVTNQALFNKYLEVGISYIKWETRPEATPSGTCSVCEGHSHGGANFDGIYPILSMPIMPAHEHCACVAVPVLG